MSWLFELLVLRALSLIMKQLSQIHNAINNGDAQVKDVARWQTDVDRYIIYVERGKNHI